jgi:hypothetical protein
LTLGLSLLLHLGLGAFASAVLTMPALDIEFELPMDVEFGMSDEVALAPAVEGASKPAEAEKPADAAGDAEGEKPKPPKPKPPASAEPATAKPENPALGQDKQTKLPAGTQIAVRVDMTRIRNSPLSEDVRALLTAIPDWQALLAGSGIDPVEQLDRFMIATPNLQREKIVVAGRYLGDEQTVLQAVERLAEAQSTTAPWNEQAGVRVAKWANPDVTPRVIAIVGPHHFTISREEDLPRVLAVAAARAARNRTKRPDSGEAPPHPADALLSMENDEGLSVEVEGAEQFVRRASRGVPANLRLSAVELPGPRLELRGRLSFTDAEKAAAGAGFWDGLRSTYAGNTLVAMLGLAEPLKQGSIVQKDAEVILTVGLSVDQARLILGYLRELVRPRTASPAPPGATATPGAAGQPSP